MNTITLPKTEYEKLLKPKAGFEKLFKFSKKPKKTFNDSAFGILKTKLGKGSSVAYIKRLRKSWR